MQIVVRRTLDVVRPVRVDEQRAAADVVVVGVRAERRATLDATVGDDRRAAVDLVGLLRPAGVVVTPKDTVRDDRAAIAVGKPAESKDGFPIFDSSSFMSSFPFSLL